MTIVQFRKLNLTDPILQRVQDNISNVFSGLDSAFLLNALLNTGVNNQGLTFVSGQDTYVNHGLNRIPLGYFVTAKNAAVDIYTSATPSPNPETVIVLKSTANAIVNMVFF